MCVLNPRHRLRRKTKTDHVDESVVQRIRCEGEQSLKVHELVLVDSFRLKRFFT